ncbi:hypothetical protein LTR41_010977 [Exophiala xenobiotica]|nr:hypothetical protein LTR41_010977 [Exophiala xenobiotica]KAK5550265.1 hypothetical protein LTR46_011733 [Exophiala xenobiotica]
MMGEPVPITEADDHIFGLVLLNDWSARDLQMTEALPLGPFCCKSFATSISPWIITLDALQPHRTPGPPRDIPVPPHLADPDPQRYRVSVMSEIYNPKTGQATTISQSRLETIYWSFRDMIAHHTSNGYPLRAGDILAGGTVSNEPVGTHSCLLEVSRHGTRAFELSDGSTRTYLADGDAVRLTAWGEQGGVGFGECVGTILPAKKLAQV